MTLRASMGGHFFAFLENRKNELPGKYGYESARASLYSLLKAMRPKRVFVPNYICDAVPAAVHASGAKVVRYPINAKLEPAEGLYPSSNDFVLLVNYFGLCTDAVHRCLDLIPATRAIIDCSQAYFFNDKSVASKIYSPRKFLPVADGGFVETTASLRCADSDEHGSIRRYQYLLERTIGEPESSRSKYVQAEKDLNHITDRSISFFTKKICETADIDFIKQRRRENFRILQGLDSINQLRFDLHDQVPLCYPLMVENGDKIRDELANVRVFTPRYWPNINPINDFEKLLLTKTVFLPVDHRYTATQMSFLLDVLVQLQ